MQILDKLKAKGINKKINSNSTRKSLHLMPVDDYHKILYIKEDESESFKDKIQKVFPSSYPHHLYLREIKVDTTIGHNYSVHESDFNLTGNLKNDKLIQLSKMQFDLVIDLSKNSTLLNYFINQIPANLIVGKMNADNAFLHDLFVESKRSDIDFLENIRKQLSILTKNGNK